MMRWRIGASVACVLFAACGGSSGGRVDGGHETGGDASSSSGTTSSSGSSSGTSSGIGLPDASRPDGASSGGEDGGGSSSGTDASASSSGADASIDGGDGGGADGSSSGGDASVQDGGSSGGDATTSDGGNDGGRDAGSNEDAGLPPDGGDPVTCAQAASLHSYVGCDYWPTVTANNVWSIFDFAVVVANAGSATATVTVTGPSSTNITTTVAPGSLTTIPLPWVPSLKGPDSDNCGTATPIAASVLATASAFHLVSSVPVIAYQFNALEYVGQGGPAGKDWSACPGNTTCATDLTPIGCYSFTNDASLLFPTTALTGNYRVTGHPGWSAANIGATVSITATQDATTVKVAVGSAGQIIAGTGIAATAANGTLTLTMNAGDVAELVGGATDTSDLSGSLVQATNPVQVITGVPCLDVPSTAEACDHVEESNFPAETLGKDYVVAQPTGPKGDAVGQLVTFYGNVDGTTLAYVPSTPAGCPATLNAGQVVTCGVVAADFEVTGSEPFAVSVHTQGASVVDPLDVAPDQQGDPDQSLPAPVEQYRTKYVFLAPTDYPNNDLVVVAPTGTTVTLDGVVAAGTATAIGTSGWSVLRITLGTGTTGAHTLTASSPVGLQVMGYGSYTSYQYPGGLDLEHIAPPPSL